MATHHSDVRHDNGLERTRRVGSSIFLRHKCRKGARLVIGTDDRADLVAAVQKSAEDPAANKPVGAGDENS